MFSFGRKEQYIILVLIGVIIFGVGVKFAIAKNSPAKPKIVQKEGLQEKNNKNKIYVHISGAVAKPGLYEFVDGDRVKDAVDKAVANEKADIDSLNLAEKLTDGQKIIIYEKGQAPAMNNPGKNSGVKSLTGSNATSSGSSNGTNKSLSPGEKINLNRADAAQLDKLPGIGLSTAQKIIDYRNANGGFKSIDEVKKVKGIGDKKYSDIKDYITI